MSKNQKKERGKISGIKIEEAHHSIFKKVYRYLGDVFARRLINTKITPNQITMFSFLVFILSAYFFFRGNYFSIFLGMVFLQVAIILDHIDGSLARMKGLASPYGAWLDEISGTYGFALVYLGITFGVYSQTGKPHVLVFGLLALVSSLIKKSTQNFYLTQFEFAKDVRKGLYKRIGIMNLFKPAAPILVMLFSVGAVFNQLYWVLVFWGIYYPIFTIAQNTLLTLKAMKMSLKKEKAR